MLCPIELDVAAKVFKSYVKTESLKWTNQRAVILRTFLGTDEHVSVEDMLKLLKKKNVALGQATVYRNMKLLTDCGIAEAKHFEDGVVRYDQAYGHDHHEHIICVNCRKIVEFRNQDLEDKKAQIAKDHGFKMLYHHLEIFGVCPDCQKEGAD